MIAELAGVASGTAEQHMRLGEARPGRTEVLQHTVERLAGSCQGDDMSARSDRPFPPVSWSRRKIASCSGPCPGAPDGNPAFRRAPHAGGQIRMTANRLPEHAGRTDAGTGPRGQAHSASTVSAGGFQCPDRAVRSSLCKETGPGRPADLGEPPLHIDMFQAARRSSSAECQIHASGKGGKRCLQSLAAVHDRPKAAHVDNRPA